MTVAAWLCKVSGFVDIGVNAGIGRHNADFKMSDFGMSDLVVIKLAAKNVDVF